MAARQPKGSRKARKKSPAATPRKTKPGRTKKPPAAGKPRKAARRRGAAPLEKLLDRDRKQLPDDERLGGKPGRARRKAT